MRVYIHGNCQAWAIDQMLRELDLDWEIEHRQVHLFDLDSKDERAAYSHAIETADIILAQPISQTYRGSELLSFEYIRRNAKRGCRLLSFPSIYFRAPMIQSYDLAVDGHPMDYHDAHIADMFRHGTPVDECAARIESADFFPTGFVERETMISLTLLMKREVDSAIDIGISDVIGARLNDQLLFHTFNHPTRLPLATIINRMFHRIGSSDRISMDGPSYLNNTRIQPYRSAAFQLGIPGSSLPELGTATILHDTRTMRDYIGMAYESYERHGPAAISDAIGRQVDATAYLARFHRMSIERDHRLSELDLIDQAYLAILGRSAGIDELRNWVAHGAGRNVRGMLHAMILSDEFGSVYERWRA